MHRDVQRPRVVTVVPTSSLSFAPPHRPSNGQDQQLFSMRGCLWSLRPQVHFLLKSLYVHAVMAALCPCPSCRVLLGLHLRTLSTLIDCVLCLYLRLLAMALEPVSRLMFVSLSSLDELLASRYLYWSCQGCPSALLRCWSNFLPVFSRSRPNPMILIPAVIVRYVFPLAVSALSPACLRDSDRARVVSCTCLLHVILFGACNIFIYHLQFASKVLRIAYNGKRRPVSIYRPPRHDHTRRDDAGPKIIHDHTARALRSVATTQIIC